jgi:hypothetical protein
MPVSSVELGPLELLKFSIPRQTSRSNASKVRMKWVLDALAFTFGCTPSLLMWLSSSANIRW